MRTGKFETLSFLSCLLSLYALEGPSEEEGMLKENVLACSNAASFSGVASCEPSEELLIGSLLEALKYGWSQGSDIQVQKQSVRAWTRF